MAKVNLVLESDLGPLRTALEQGNALLNQTREGVEAIGKESKAAFGVAATSASKFEHDVKTGATEVSQLNKALKATDELFKKGNGKGLEAQQKGIANVRKELEALLAFEKKLVAERDKAGPANIKEQFTKQIQEAQKETKKLTDQLAKMGGGASGGKSAVNHIKEIRNEIKRLTGEAIEAGHGTEIFTNNLRKAGELKDELNDLNAALKSVSGNTTENVGRALAESTELGVKGFEGLIAVQSLFGEENENIEKQILKLQAVQSISRLVSEFGGLNDKLHDIKLAFTPLTNLYTRGNDALKGFIKTGKETGGLAKNSKNLFTSLKTGISGLVASGKAGFKSLFATIAANPLGVLLVVIGSIIAAMVALKDKIKPIGALFEYLGKAVDLLLAPLEALGQMWGLIASEHEKASKKIIANTEKEIEAINGYYEQEIALAEISEKRTAELEKKKEKAVRARLKETINALQRLAKENGKLTDEEREQYIAAQEQLLESSRKTTLLLAKEEAERNKFARQQLSNLEDYKIALIKDDETREKAAAKKRYDDAITSLSEQAVATFDTLDEAYKEGYQSAQKLEEIYQKEVSDITRKYAEKRMEEVRKNNEKLLALQKDFADAYAAILERVQKANLDSLVGEARISKERELAMQELDILRENLIKKGQAEEDFEAKMQKRKPQVFKLNAEQEQQFEILRQNAYAKETEALIKLAVDRENAIATARTQAAQQNEQNLSVEESNLISTVNLQGKPQGMKDVDFEREKQKAILSIQSEYAMKRLELRRAALAAERAEQLKGLNGELALLQDRNDEEANIKRAQIMESVHILEDKYSAEGQKIQDETAKLINELQAQREALDVAPKFSLARFLGITEEDLQNIQATINEVQKAFDTVLTAQIEQMDAELQRSEQRQADNEQQIEQLKSKLEAEEELAARGKANNQSRIQEEIAQQEEALQKEREMQQKALEEKKKIQKQKLLIDSITQATNLITASTEILANTAKDPISTGIALGTITAMLVGFGIAKAQALKLINSSGNEPQNFAKGVIDLQGPGTETSDSIPANLSKGESVMTAKETKSYKDLFLGIRNKDRKQLEKGVVNLIDNEGLKNIFYNDRRTERVTVMQNLKELLGGTGVSLPRELPQRIAGNRTALQNFAARTLVNNDFGSFGTHQKQTVDELKKLLAATNKKPVIYTQGDYTVIKKGNHTTRIKNK